MADLSTESTPAPTRVLHERVEPAGDASWWLEVNPFSITKGHRVHEAVRSVRRRSSITSYAKRADNSWGAEGEFLKVGAEELSAVLASYSRITPGKSWNLSAVEEMDESELVPAVRYSGSGMRDLLLRRSKKAARRAAGSQSLTR